MEKFDPRSLTGAQIRAARGLLGMSAEALAGLAHLGVATIRRAELVEGPTALTLANAERIIQVLAEAGVMMIAANGGGMGVRFAHAPAEVKTAALDRT